MDNKVTICKQTHINAGSELQIYSEAETSVQICEIVSTLFNYERINLYTLSETGKYEKLN